MTEPTPRRQRILHRLTSPALPWWAAVVGVLLVAPSLGAGWAVDDFVHRRFLLDSIRFPWDLYGFLKGDPEMATALIRASEVPWWTLPEIRIAFFRPLASLTQWLDYRLWPDSAVLMHAHSIAWYGACVLVAGLLYRRIMGVGAAAGLAVLLFAIDDAHHMPVTWIANRNVLPAFFFGVLALMAHDRWRRGGWRWGACVGPALVALSLFSAEAGVATLGYLAAHVLFLDRGALRTRVMALVPYIVVVVLWRGMYAWVGYGTWGSGFYTDPATDPLGFAGCVAQRGPILLFMQYVLSASFLDGIMALFGPTWTWAAAGGAIVVGLIAVTRPVLRDHPDTAFWATGMLMSLVPVCATIPMARLLFFCGLGAFALIARFITALAGSAGTPAASSGVHRAGRAVATLFVIMHVVVAPGMLAWQSRHVIPPHAEPRLFIPTPEGGSSGERRIVAVNSPSVFHGRHSRVMERLKGHDFPGQVLFLAPSWTAVTVTRPDERTLVVTPQTGYLVRPLDVLFRGAHVPMPLGTQVEVDGMTVEITAVGDDARPTEATFTFEQPLEHPQWYWMKYEGNAYVPLKLPAVGETLELSEPRL